MYYNSQNMLSPERSSFNSLKGINPQDSMLSLFPDDDSGFNSTLRSRSRSGLYISDDYNTSPGGMSRSRSMTRLPMTSSQDLGDPSLNQSLQSLRVRPFEHSLRHMKDNLDDSENRRIVLVHKLKEAQETLELQNDRLNRIEGTAKTNSVLVDDLKYKEKDYRDRINQLEKSEEDKAMLRMENNRLRDEMQSRIDKLDYALRSLQAQHQVSETENIKRSSLLEQSTTALSLLENENTRLKKDKDSLRQEILVAKEAMELTREKFTPIESENKNLRNEMERMKEENERLAHKSEMSTNKLKDLKELTETMKDENEKLAHSWKTLSEEKQKLVTEIDRNQDNHREARARVTNLSTERDRLFNEKMELNNKVQQLAVDKEQVEKTKIALEEQIAEQEEELSRVRKGVKRKDEERRLLEETIHDSKNNYDDLYKELTNTRAYYERSLEQISVLENNKQLAMQQLELAEHEKERLRQDNDRLREGLERKSGDLKNERQQLEEAVLDLKGDLRQLRQDKSKAEDKAQGLEIKLQKANDDVREIATMKQEEIDTLKSTCDRLSASSSKKDSEIQNMSEKLEQVDMQNERLKDELRGFKDECENLSDQVEDIKKYKDENRRLLQEKAENEQVIKLLETQKDVLSKSADSSMEKLKDIDKLTDKIDQYRNDNEHLRSRIGELEKVRDSLIAQKEELLANSELIYKKPQLEELESKIDELRDANKQLRDINEQVNEKAEALQQENVTLKDAVGGDGSVVPRVELERLTREKERLQSELDYQKKEHENLEERHQRFIIQYGHEGSETRKDKEVIDKLNAEKDALEKTVALINGQMLLVEGGKRRLDDVVDDLQTEIQALRQQLEEAEKKPRHQPEVEALQEEVNILNEQLDEAKYEQDKQRRLIQTLKDESLDDVGTELRDMRDELHKLMGVIESKDHAIETLENQLRTSKEDNVVKQQAMSDLQVLVCDLEKKNGELKHSVDGVRHSVEEKLLSPRHSSPSPTRSSRSPTTRASRIPRKIDDVSSTSQSGESTTILGNRRAVSQDRGREILRRLKPAESVFKRESQSQTRSSTDSELSEGIEVVPGQYGSKFISKQIKRSHSEKGGDRLQSLISKYRGYSESGGHQERKIKPLSVSPASSKMGLVTKGRSFGPAAPKTDKEVSRVESESGVIEVLQLPSSSSPLSNSISCSQKSSPSFQENSANDKEASVVGRQDMNVQTGADGATETKQEMENEEEDDGTESDEKSDEEESDSEQKDIDNLIDRNSSHPRPLLSVSPPKITSKVIGDLLKTMPSSSYTDMSPGTPPQSPLTSALPDSL